jgi:thiamine biosynthesis lipoprotein
MRLVGKIIGLIALSVASGLAGCRDAARVQVADERPLMGTTVLLKVEGEEEAMLRRAMAQAYTEMGRLSDMMNHYRPESVVSEINRQAGIRPVPVPRELMEVLQMARKVSERSDGAFDITVGSLRGWRFNPERPAMPSPREIEAMLPRVDFRRVILDPAAGTAFLSCRGVRIDLGGIAKLYILHAGMGVLRRHGVRHAMVNGGGDVAVMGDTRGRPWRIGLRHPRRPGELLGVVELRRGFVVTSGDYERYFLKDGKRYHHILGPRTGYPATGPQQVTLVAQDMEQVNGLSAAIMVLGRARGRELIARTPGLDGLIVDRDGGLWQSPGFTKRWLEASPAVAK